MGTRGGAHQGWVERLSFQTWELRLCLPCTPQAPSCPSALGVAGPQWSTQVTPGELCEVQLCEVQPHSQGSRRRAPIGHPACRRPTGRSARP